MLSSCPIVLNHFGESGRNNSALQQKKVKRRRKLRVLISSLLLVAFISVWKPDPSRHLQEYITTSDAKNKNYQSFNKVNPHEGWCPNAVCHNSPICAPCNRRYLFILAPGRTGSTTLLSMFNLLPGVRIAGENFGELNLAEDLLSVFRDQSPDSNFVYDQPVRDGSFRHNAIPKGAMSCVAQRLLYSLNPPPMEILEQNTIYPTIESYDSDTILGVKTIRLFRKDWTSHDVAEYLKETFPCARYIVNKRSDIEEHAHSISTEFETSDSIDEIKAQLVEEAEFYETLTTELGGEIVMATDLEEWKNDVNILNNVLKWLGFKNCLFDTILHDNNAGYNADTSHHISLGKQCKAI